MPQYSIQPTSILQEYQTTQTDPEHLQGRELCVFGIITEHEFICCFLHWIQSVNPHFYVTLYYNGSPYIIERRKDKKISLGEFIFLVLRKSIPIFS